MAVGIGDDLHGLASFDRVRGDQLRHATRSLRAEALDRALNDRRRLAACVSGSKNTPRRARANRRIDLVGIARRRADQDEIGRRTFLKERLHVRRDVRRALVVIRRLERHALVLEHFEQRVCKSAIDFADLVDEKHAAVRARHEAELRFGNAGLGELATAALIDRIVHAAEQRIGRLARIPAQRRTARFDERRILSKRCIRTRLCQLRAQDARRSSFRRPAVRTE